MNRAQARALASRMEADDGRAYVTGYRNYGGAIVIDAVDTRTGYSFVIDSPEQWEQMKADAALIDSEGGES